MKGLFARIAGPLFAVSLVLAPVAAANEDREEGRVGYVPSGAVMVTEAGLAMVPGARVYVLQDDPSYDLSGSGKTLVLVPEGGTYRTDSWSAPVAFARAGGGSREVVTIPAQYRQHWLAVAAGDRPVRRIASVPIPSEKPAMAFVPVYFMRGADTDRARYSSTNGGERKVVKKTSQTRRKHAMRARSTSYRTAAYTKHRRNGATTASYQRNGNGRAVTAAYPRNANRYTYAEAMTEPERTRDLYQIKSSWYQIQPDGWSRSDSWRGPFVPVAKGTVPREVIKSESDPFKD